MLLTIDTDKPLNATDRVILSALLNATTTPPHHTAPAAQSGDMTGFQERIRDQIGRPPVHADARRRVAQQPGVTTRESVPEDAPDDVDAPALAARQQDATPTPE